MLFKKDRDPRHDMKEIKESINYNDDIMDEEKPFAALPPLPPPRPREYDARPEQSAPLFVKVEKYREVISSLQEMKLFVAGVKDIFTVMQEIESIRGEALNVMKVTVQRLEKAVVEMDSELLRPRGVNVSPFPQGEAEVKHIESSLTELQKQLLELRQDLQGMR